MMYKKKLKTYYIKNRTLESIELNRIRIIENSIIVILLFEKMIIVNQFTSD